MRLNPTKLLCDLISLPTVNPAFLPAGHAHAGEKKATDFLAALTATYGLSVELQEALPGRPNLLARLTPAAEVKHRILLAPHLDTVNAADEQFIPQQKNGRIWGRGACDTKGSAAAMVVSILEMARGGLRPRHTEIIFVGLVDEEDSQFGSRALAKSGLKADLAIVGEPTGLRVVTAHKGSLWLRLDTSGRLAHGCRPELGKNAVHMMARVVDVLETEYVAMLSKRIHPVLGKATSSVGSINGGTQPNIVPDSCTISVDRRTLPGETEQGVFGELNGLLRSHRLKARISSYKQAPCLALETNPGLPFVRRFLDSVGQTQPFGVNYFCDASVLAQNGIPGVVFGPGNIAHAHTSKEWLSCKSLNRACLILQRFLRGLP
jgi:acetylornithine deacetylase/succinyl-diaminopimelate desuccinylase-like protein